MKFSYDLDSIVSALDYYDLRGLINLLDNAALASNEPSLSEMETIFKEKFIKAPQHTKKKIETLMLTCARVNSIGF